MSKTEIIAELDRMSSDDRAEIQAKLDELAGNDWQDRVAAASIRLSGDDPIVGRPPTYRAETRPHP